MDFTPSFLIQLALALGSSVAVYVGVKIDLAVTRNKAENAQADANSAHQRIDSILNRK